MDANDGAPFQFCPCGADAVIRSDIQGMSLVVTCTRCGTAAATTRPDLAQVLATTHRLRLKPGQQPRAALAAASLATELALPAHESLPALRAGQPLPWEFDRERARRAAAALARHGFEFEIEPPLAEPD